MPDVTTIESQQSMDAPFDDIELSFKFIYCQAFNISHTWIANNLVDHSDVVGAPPVGAAPTTSSYLT